MTENNNEGLAQRMAIARKRAGLTQAQVADIVGLYRPAISEIESGRRKVSAEELHKFADAYGVSLDWLLEGSKDDDPRHARIELAARELAKLKNDDLDVVIDLLRSLKTTG